LKSDQHIDLITNGQRATRHADRPYVFYFFATAHFLKTILASRTNGTFDFARHTNRLFAKPKEPFLPNHKLKHLHHETK
jgi:hypothetical protein